MFNGLGIGPTKILLPNKEVNLTSWACVACDQYTSQPEVWAEIASTVGEKPSTLKLILPECYLDEAHARTEAIIHTMKDYLKEGVLQPVTEDGFILVERTTESGSRLGLICGVDLECYDFSNSSETLIRPTEGTIISRLPPRIAVRKRAPLELPHVLLLMDDPACSVIDPLMQQNKTLTKLYDFEMMINGGHLRGWLVEDADHKKQIAEALHALLVRQSGKPFLFAVGDGNHSLAAAKAYWDEVKRGLTPAEQLHHPARYALVEVENIHDKALNFEPIHRILSHVDAAALLEDWKHYCSTHGMTLHINETSQGHCLEMVAGKQRYQICISGSQEALPVGTLQGYLDDFLKRHEEAIIDYVHGDEVLCQLSRQEHCVGFLLSAIEKDSFFASIQQAGSLPRKTFSLGNANEKRFYMEAREIK